ncbi:adenine phosphoribosyltransferase [Bifidobacterium sp.]|jgi:adenine phosphoribosyltransferase|uniref:adenine phosphoribosyltransferase n=1 Tax=Bifidobacterium sp. TaxID=41200 RepID=UPI0025BB91BA|nr:adenine phosphoribosyltransferase [Bifidobacterium sp.]MCH4160201.1 adenine phosphoribosyltransferase [Bifidobacterium sp.]MCH4174328.1 adenine phosphoribosyltransferase [Bifidobacterium sp.]MCI1635738.1 adenine phosphoribosyltransferase [Bifidobacterium sp.]
MSKSDITAGDITSVKSLQTDDIDYIISLFRSTRDFPKEGILFRDFMPILADTRGFSLLITAMIDALPVSADEIDAVAGLEARGFLLGPVVAHALGKSFIAVRKAGKLPPKTLRETYALEYGSACVEIEEHACNQGERVLIIDDLIATGGSAHAAANLIEAAGANVVGYSFVMELEGLDGRDALEHRPVSSLFSMPA